MTDGGIYGDAGEAVRAAAFGADDKIRESDRNRGISCTLCKLHFHPLAALFDRGAGAAAFLNDEHFDRAARRFDGALQVAAAEFLASERDKEDGSHIGMSAHRFQDAMGIVAWIAAGKADELRALLNERLGNA